MQHPEQESEMIEQVRELYSTEQLIKLAENCSSTSSSFIYLECIDVTNNPPELIETMLETNFASELYPKVAKVIAKASLTSTDTFSGLINLISENSGTLIQCIENSLSLLPKPSEFLSLMEEFSAERMLIECQPSKQSILTHKNLSKYIKLSDEIVEVQKSSVEFLLNEELTIPTCEFLEGLLLKSDFKSEVEKEFVYELIEFINESLIEIMEFDYKNLKAVNELFEYLMIQMINKKFVNSQVLFEATFGFVKTMIEHDSHYLFQLNLQILQKIYEERSFMNHYYLYKEKESGKIIVQQYVFDELWEMACQETGFLDEEIEAFATEMEEFNQMVLERSLFFINKDALKSKLYGMEQSEESTAFLDQDYQYEGNIVLWQEYFGVMKQEITNLLMKMSTLYPNECLAFCNDMIQTLYNLIGELPDKISMQSEPYFALDSALSMCEEVIKTILKLFVNENDFKKSRMFDLEILENLMGFICNSVIPEQIEEKICMYRHFTTICEIPKFLQKLSREFNLNASKTQAGNNEKDLLEEFRDMFRILLTECIENLIENVNIRDNRLEEHTYTNNLFANLSEDTLSLRRLISTKLETYFNTDLIVDIFFNDTENGIKIFDHATYENTIDSLDLLLQKRVLTEKEELNITQAKINLMLSIECNNYSEDEKIQSEINSQLGNVLSTELDYFENLSSVMDVQSFMQHFNISFDSSLFNQTITASSVELKRLLKFKLNEAFEIVLPMFEKVEDDGILEFINSLIELVQELLEIILSLASREEFLPPEFVYLCNPLKVNLLEEQDEHLELDIDEPQSTISELEYTLEWLESIFETSTRLLLLTNNQEVLVQIFLQADMVPINYEKLFCSNMIKNYTYEPELETLINNYLQNYIPTEFYPLVLINFDELGLVRNQTDPEQLIRDQLVVFRQDLSTEQLNLISSSVFLVGLRCWSDLEIKVLGESFEEEEFCKNFVIFDEDARCSAEITEIFVNLVAEATEPIKCSELMTIFVVSLIENKGQKSIQENLVQILFINLRRQIAVGYFDDLIEIGTLFEEFDLESVVELLSVEDAKEAKQNLIAVLEGLGVM